MVRRSSAIVAVLTVAILTLFAGPASAHASNVSHAETCNDDGTTTTLVTFDNDYNLTADVTYRWGTETPGTVHLAAKTSSTNPTVSLPAHDTGLLSYHVTWSDSFRQPAEGESSLVTLPLVDCHAATTTTTLASTTTTTTVLAVVPPHFDVPALVAPTTTTTAPAAILGTNEAKQLPRTGFPFAFYTALGLLALLLGGLARYASRAERG